MLHEVHTSAKLCTSTKVGEISSTMVIDPDTQNLSNLHQVHTSAKLCTSHKVGEISSTVVIDPSHKIWRVCMKCILSPNYAPHQCHPSADHMVCNDPLGGIDRQLDLA